MPYAGPGTVLFYLFLGLGLQWILHHSVTVFSVSRSVCLQRTVVPILRSWLTVDLTSQCYCLLCVYVLGLCVYVLGLCHILGLTLYCVVF